MYKNILLPLDSSKIAEEAINTAINLAKALDAKVILMQVIEIIPILRKDKESEREILKGRSDKYLTRIKEKMEKDGVSVNVVIKEGEAELEICRYASRFDVDLIILSTHGLGGITKSLLGSVSNKVVRRSTKPVLLVRPYLKDPLKDKIILVVDDEPDILESVEELLDMCVVYKASDYDTALKYIRTRTFDIIILDIMGVNGFELLKESVSRGIPTVMLTAHALTPEALEKSIELGAVSFLPKEKMLKLADFLRDVIECDGTPVWKKLFSRLETFFNKTFGSDWQKKKIDILKDFEDAARKVLD